MEVLRFGSRGSAVVYLQSLLGIKEDGHFGKKTGLAVVEFQEGQGLMGDGIVGVSTWKMLGVPSKMSGEDLDSDNNSYVTGNDLLVNKYYLPKGEYIKEGNKPEYCFLHHTAGRENPYKVVDSWGRDDRGRVGTEFVLGGQSHTSGIKDYDGELVQCFAKGGFAYHLGKVGSRHMKMSSVGIEICSMGYLDSSNKTYVGSKCLSSQTCKLSEPFKGYVYWHRYSEKQIEILGKWIKYIGERDGIDMRVGLQEWIKKYGPTKAFGFHQDAYEGKVKGLLTHTNVRKDKWDCYPDPNLVDMIMSI
tara:strand:+ start:1268 stop:2176 length:909 start_codon:yes stop_codon:yes gene_type:complete